MLVLLIDVKGTHHACGCGMTVFGGVLLGVYVSALGMRDGVVTMWMVPLMSDLGSGELITFLVDEDYRD